jgi:hypothetical protein
MRVAFGGITKVYVPGTMNELNIPFPNSPIHPAGTILLPVITLVLTLTLFDASRVVRERAMKSLRIEKRREPNVATAN